MGQVQPNPKPPNILNYRVMADKIIRMSQEERDIWILKTSLATGKRVKFFGAVVVDYDLREALIRGK